MITFKPNYKDDLIYHLKHGRVLITKKTADSLYLTENAKAITVRIGPVFVFRDTSQQDKIKLIPVIKS